MLGMTLPMYMGPTALRGIRAILLNSNTTCVPRTPLCLSSASVDIPRTTVARQGSLSEVQGSGFSLTLITLVLGPVSISWTWMRSLQLRQEADPYRGEGLFHR